jgi:hypothetical protein
MNNKVLTNFRDHPSFRFDEPQSVFKIDDKVYLIREGVVRPILPSYIDEDNIGEPYKKLIYLYFIFGDEVIGVYSTLERICFAPEHEEALRQLLS